MTFTLSIKPAGEAPAFQHGYHLGTIERTARQIAEEKFNARVSNGMPTESVALMQSGKIFDVFDGEWASARPCIWDV